MLDKEKEQCCGMGCQGCLCCFFSAICLCPFQMGLSASLRADAAKDFRVDNGGTCTDNCKGCLCVPCSIYQVYVSLEYWTGKLDLTSLDTDSRHPAAPVRMNTATEIVLARLGETHTFDENDIAAARATPPPKAPPSSRPTPSQASNSRKNTTGSERGSERDSSIRTSTTSSRGSSIRVAIPAGHYAGSKFEVESPTGDLILVAVPQGGKPGMQMDIPL